MVTGMFPHIKTLDLTTVTTIDREKAAPSIERRQPPPPCEDRIGTGPPRARTEAIYDIGLFRARSTQKGVRHRACPDTVLPPSSHEAAMCIDARLHDHHHHRSREGITPSPSERHKTTPKWMDGHEGIK